MAVNLVVVDVLQSEPTLPSTESFAAVFKIEHLQEAPSWTTSNCEVMPDGNPLVCGVYKDIGDATSEGV